MISTPTMNQSTPIPASRVYVSSFRGGRGSGNLKVNRISSSCLCKCKRAKAKYSYPPVLRTPKLFFIHHSWSSLLTITQSRHIFLNVTNNDIFQSTLWTMQIWVSCSRITGVHGKSDFPPLLRMISIQQQHLGETSLWSRFLHKKYT